MIEWRVLIGNDVENVENLEKYIEFDNLQINIEIDKTECMKVLY